MGQYSAMVAAGTLSLADGLRLVRERGRLMQDASPDGAMAAIIGLDEAREPDLLAAGAAVGVLTIANRNSPGQIVVSGDRAAVTAASEAAREPRRSTRDRPAGERRRTFPADGAGRGRHARSARLDRPRRPRRAPPRERGRATR